MGTAAAVAGDKITGICAGHLTIGPAGAAIPAPPMPFSAPLTTGLASSVMIGGKPAAMAGSGGTALPPHVGLHASDPYFTPTTQKGTVLSGSTTVLVEGQPLANMSSSCTMCMAPAVSLLATAATVLVG